MKFADCESVKCAESPVKVFVASGTQAGFSRLVVASMTTVIPFAQMLVNSDPFVPVPKADPLVEIRGNQSAVGEPSNVERERTVKNRRLRRFKNASILETV
jgi:hypothetical protein